MSIYLFTNNAQTTLASPITAGATTCTLATGQGAKFPSPSTGQVFTLTFNDAATGLLSEICLCTARSADTLTIIRGQEGTTPQSWLAGDFASNYLTAAASNAFAQTQSNIPTVKSVTTAFYTQLSTDTTLSINIASDCTITLLNPASYNGNILYIKNIQGYQVLSATANIVPAGSTTLTSVILEAVVGTSCMLQSDGTNWNVISTSFQPSGF